jgi:hypothetical protein
MKRRKYIIYIWQYLYIITKEKAKDCVRDAQMWQLDRFRWQHPKQGGEREF